MLKHNTEFRLSFRCTPGQMIRDAISSGEIPDAVLLIMDDTTARESVLTSVLSAARGIGVRNACVLAVVPQSEEDGAKVYESFLKICRRARSFYSPQTLPCFPCLEWPGTGALDRLMIHPGWYNGVTLAAWLEKCATTAKTKQSRLRLVPVPGTESENDSAAVTARVVRGTVREGDMLLSWPDRTSVQVRRVDNLPSGGCDRANRQDMVRLELSGWIIPQRGQFLTGESDFPMCVNRLTALLLTYGSDKLEQGKDYQIIYRDGVTKCRVVSCNRSGDSDDVFNGNGSRDYGTIVEAVLETTEPVYVDRFADCPAFGSFQVSTGTSIVGEGIIIETETGQRDKDLFWTQQAIGRHSREARNGHRSFIIWMVGLSCSGKSTLARELEKLFFSHGLQVVVLDGDNIRQGLCADLGFSRQDKREHFRRVGEVAKLFMNAGVIAISAFITPYAEDREMIRQSVGNGDFFEVYLDCPVDRCAARDYKGLYEKARSNRIPEFAGVNAPFEVPDNPELTVDTYGLSVPETVKRIYEALAEQGLINLGERKYD
jgi:bifunctional enzyme CysN/CysC